MNPSRIVLLLAVLVLGAVPAAAPAAPATGTQRLLTDTLSAQGTTTAACHRGVRAGRPGVAVRTVRASSVGETVARLDGRRGDWDLAIFDASGRLVGGGASPAADEVASGFGAGELTIQACRRLGAAGPAKLAVRHRAFPKSAKPEKVSLVDVRTPTRQDKNRLMSMGFDLTEHGSATSLGVVLHGADDAARLRRAGFTWTVEVADLAKRDLAVRRADERNARAIRRSALPSGRDTYRTLADYENEMKTLAQQNPGLVKLVELPNKTWLGRTVYGLEITTDVNVNNGKPAFMNLGVHHAREWPSGEHAMEWAYELVNGYKNGNARAKRIVEQSRNIVVPIVNPDGFNASRGAAGAPAGGRDEALPDDAYFVAGTPTGGEYRRKNCRLPDDSEGGNCFTSAGLAEPGVDPNRNYGGLWGGPGADASNPFTQTYRGPGPFSEPETRNIQWLVSRNQVATLITNHTTAGLVLRAPGVALLGDPVDEHRGYKALGDAMAKENGYFSQKGFELYDTTGTTEDWSYNATGGFGFTFEIYCGAPNYETGDCDDPAFHPLHETMVKEWTGDSDQSNHATDPGPTADTPFGMQPGYDGKGNREAYYLAAESTINTARHSVLEGTGPAGATLRLVKQFKTLTWPQEQESGDPKPLEVDDRLETVFDVPASGVVDWHINPSTRPQLAKTTGRAPAGPPSPKADLSGGPTGPATPGPGDNGDGGATPCPTYFEVGPDSCPAGSASWNDHPFTFQVGGGTDNETATVRFTFPESDDWDLEIYVDRNGNGVSDPGAAGDGPVVASSGNGATSGSLGFEETTLPRPAATTQYVARMVNFAASPAGYDGEAVFTGPPPFQPAQRETYTLTCEKHGRVFDTQQVYVDRGERVRPDFTACTNAIAAFEGRTTTTAQQTSCTARGGFRSVRARGAARRVALSFSRRVSRPVTVDVFQQSIGRRVIGERLIARFANRSRGFTWNGRANRRGRRVTDGYYFVRYRITGTKDVRRVTLRRARGRWSVRPSFYRPDSCDLVRSYKLTRPVFGGRGNREVGASFRLARNARVSLEVLRGTRVVKRFRATARRANVTHRLRVRAEGLRRSDHKFRLTVVEGGRTQRYTLTSRRL
jgi:hypothetical protein